MNNGDNGTGRITRSEPEFQELPRARSPEVQRTISAMRAAFGRLPPGPDCIWISMEIPERRVLQHIEAGASIPTKKL